jgi:hypothetical protein
VIWLGAFWRLVGVLAEVGPAGVLVATAVTAGVLLTVVLAARVLRRVDSGPGPLVTRRILRAQAGRTGIPRHRDPDASGRPRPRAPTAALAAA